MEVVPPSMSLAPTEAPASRPVTRSLTPLTVVPSCMVPPEVVVSGSPRSHCPVVAVSVPFGFVVQPWLVSKLSKKTVVGGGVPPPLQARMALFTFNRPPVTVLPESELIGSTLFMRFAFKLAVLNEHLESTSAAAPETCGVAIEVPLKTAKPPLGRSRGCWCPALPGPRSWRRSWRRRIYYPCYRSPRPTTRSARHSWLGRKRWCR